MEERKKRDRRTFAKTHSKDASIYKRSIVPFSLSSSESPNNDRREDGAQDKKVQDRQTSPTSKSTRSQTHRKVCFQTSRTYTFFRVSSTYYDCFPHSTSTHNKRPPRTATTKTTPPLTMMISKEWTVRKYKCDQGKISDSFPTGSDSGSTKYRRRNSQFPVLSDTLVISHRANNNRTTITYLFKRTLTE